MRKIFFSFSSVYNGDTGTTAEDKLACKCRHKFLKKIIKERETLEKVSY
jgi:hypothetical protein